MGAARGGRPGPCRPKVERAAPSPACWPAPLRAPGAEANAGAQAASAACRGPVRVAARAQALLWTGASAVAACRAAAERLFGRQPGRSAERTGPALMCRAAARRSAARTSRAVWLLDTSARGSQTLDTHPLAQGWSLAGRWDGRPAQGQVRLLVPCIMRLGCRGTCSLVWGGGAAGGAVRLQAQARAGELRCRVCARRCAARQRLQAARRCRRRAV